VTTSRQLVPAHCSGMVCLITSVERARELTVVVERLPARLPAWVAASSAQSAGQVGGAACSAGPYVQLLALRADPGGHPITSKPAI
jgi:hypothetical protein